MPRSSDESVLQPLKFIAYVARRQGRSVRDMRLPRSLVVFYQRRDFEEAKRLAKARTVDWWYAGPRLATGSFRGVPLSLYSMPIGAAASSVNIEELIACGVGEIIEVGICGSIVRSVTPGSVFVVERAFSDEGTSRHYFPRSRIFLPDLELTARLSAALSPLGAATGAVWTTDAPYRETRGKVFAFRKRGVIGVNMETSALFCVSKYRGARIASVQVVSDVVTEDRWRPEFHGKPLREMIMKATRVALAVLAETSDRAANKYPLRP